MPISEPLRDILRDDKFFYEELLFLTEGCREMFINFEYLLNFKIYNKLTFFDIIKVHRFFYMIKTFFCTHLETYLESNPILVYRSILPVYKDEDFENLLSNFVLDEEKVSDFIEIFSWFSGEDKIFDLQYRPLIGVEDHYIFPLNIFCNSNLLRNSLYIVRKRLYDNNQVDPLADILQKVLKEKFEFVEIQVNYKKFDYNGDIDVLVKQDDCIFIFECKNTMLPGNIYELRSTYDNIIKGAEQLTKISNALSDENFKKYFYERFGWDLNENYNITTCIVLGTRIFSGYRIENHPVRSIYELVQFIDKGEILYENEPKMSQWQDDNFVHTDLLKYIKEDLYHSICFDSMQSKDLIYQMNNTQITFSTFFANYEMLLEKQEKIFRKIDNK